MSKAFIDATASYFGLPDDTLTAVSTDAGGMFAQFTIYLTDEQIQGIVKRMAEMPTPADAPEPAFTGLPTLQEVMAAPEHYVGVAGCEGVLAKAASKSRDVAARIAAVAAQSAPPVGDEFKLSADGRYRNAAGLTREDVDLSAGRPAGRQVEHGPEAEPEDIPSPPLVWLPAMGCTPEQLACPVGVDVVRGQVAVYEDQLTEAQRAVREVPLRNMPVIPQPTSGRELPKK